MDADQVALLRVLLEGNGLDERVVDFSTSLGAAPHSEGGLLLVGTPDEEPWHFAAHLSDEARYVARPELTPTLVRWAVPPDAPPHLAVGLDRLEHVARRETLLVVSPDATPERLLDRVADARKGGALILAIETGDRDLRSLAHESLTVPGADAGPYLDVVEHVVSTTAGTATVNRRTVRSRLGRILDKLQGTH